MPTKTEILPCTYCREDGGFHEDPCHDYSLVPAELRGPGNSKEFMQWQKDKREAAAHHLFVHGPFVLDDFFNCEKCNYDNHTCPGCGEWLYHGTDVCGPCRRDLR